MRHVGPFWRYYGGKWRAAPRYPRPETDTIVEPFAGAAGYSCRYPNLRVILVDADPIIAGIWRYLISVKPAEVLAIPDIPEGGTVDDLEVCQEARWLAGFWCNPGTTYPRKSPTGWIDVEIDGTRKWGWGTEIRQRIARDIPRIRHWQIIEGPYTDAPDIDATWFVDPPYQTPAGAHYRKQVDGHAALGRWCQERQGQVIACDHVRQAQEGQECRGDLPPEQESDAVRRFVKMHTRPRAWVEDVLAKHGQMPMFRQSLEAVQSGLTTKEQLRQYWRDATLARAAAHQADMKRIDAAFDAAVHPGAFVNRVELAKAAGQARATITEADAAERELGALMTLPHIVTYSLCVALWEANGREVYIIDPRVAEAFGNTAPLAGDETELRMPAPAIAIVAPGVCDVLVAEVEPGRARFIPAQSDLSPHMGTAVDLRLGGYSDAVIVEKDPKALRSIRVALNLLTALSSTNLLTVEDMVPERPSRRQQARNEAAGVTHERYRYVWIRGYSQVAPAPTPKARSGQGGTRRLHLCSGHWSRYWVKQPSPEDRPDAVRKTSADNVVHRVTRWIEPHWRGTGERVQRITKVKEWR